MGQGCEQGKRLLFRLNKGRIGYKLQEVRGNYIR
jgi:hypothetical protein